MCIPRCRSSWNRKSDQHMHTMHTTHNVYNTSTSHYPSYGSEHEPPSHHEPRNLRKVDCSLEWRNGSAVGKPTESPQKAHSNKRLLPGRSVTTLSQSQLADSTSCCQLLCRTKILAGILCQQHHYQQQTCWKLATCSAVLALLGHADVQRCCSSSLVLYHPWFENLNQARKRQEQAKNKPEASIK